MKRLTTDKPETMTALSLNQCFIRDGEAWFRDFEHEVSCRNFARQLLKMHTDADYTECNDEDFDEYILDALQYGEAVYEGLIAMYYNALCALAEVRETLKKYEDAEEHGLLVRPPCKVGDTVWVLRKGGYNLTGLHRGWNYYVDKIRFSYHDLDRYDEFYPTREEAERALKEKWK